VSNLIETTNSLDEGVFAALYNNFDTLLFNKGLVIVFLIALFGIMLWKKAFMNHPILSENVIKKEIFRPILLKNYFDSTPSI